MSVRLWYLGTWIYFVSNDSDLGAGGLLRAGVELTLLVHLMVVVHGFYEGLLCLGYSVVQGA